MPALHGDLGAPVRLSPEEEREAAEQAVRGSMRRMRAHLALCVVLVTLAVVALVCALAVRAVLAALLFAVATVLFVFATVCTSRGTPRRADVETAGSAAYERAQLINGLAPSLAQYIACTRRVADPAGRWRLEIHT